MMRLSGITKVLVSIIVLSFLSACNLRPSETNQSSHDYLSITLTTVTDKENQFEMNNYCYDFDTKETIPIASFNYTSQYPLTYYDKVDDMVYYTEKSEQQNDEIYQYNCKTKKSKQMTEGIFAVNAIFKINEKELALIAVKDGHLLQLYTLDTKDKKLKKVETIGTGIHDFMISAQYYNQKDNSLIIVGYDDAKESKLRDQYNSEVIDSYSVEYNIYKYSFETKEYTKITSTTNGDITSIVGNDKIIYYQEVLLNDGTRSVIEYNIQTQEKQEIKELDSIYQLVSLRDDSHEIFYIENQDIGQTSLKKIDLSTRNDEVVFTHKVEGQINNGFTGYMK